MPCRTHRLSIKDRLLLRSENRIKPTGSLKQDSLLFGYLVYLEAEHDIFMQQYENESKSSEVDESPVQSEP